MRPADQRYRDRENRDTSGQVPVWVVFIGIAVMAWLISVCG